MATTGNDSAAGTLAQPLRSIQRAVDLVAATESDDVVAVMDALGEVAPDPT